MNKHRSFIFYINSSACTHVQHAQCKLTQRMHPGQVHSRQHARTVAHNTCTRHITYICNACMHTHRGSWRGASSAVHGGVHHLRQCPVHRGTAKLATTAPCAISCGTSLSSLLDGSTEMKAITSSALEHQWNTHAHSRTYGVPSDAERPG